MSLLKQALWAAGIIVAAVLASANFLPATHPLLDRIGLLTPMTRIGLAHSAESAEAPVGKPLGGPSGGMAAGPVRVIATAPTPQVMRDIVTAIGTARAVRSVTLTAEVPGRIVAMNVASGDYVAAGTVIAEIDSQAARIAADRAALMVRDAQATRDRLGQLKATGATTDTLVQQAELAFKTAQLEEQQAQFNLSQHHITAPITGWVGILVAETGNQLPQSGEVTRIEDRSSLIVDFRVPERVVSRLSPGDTLIAKPLADPALELAGTITAIDNRVDEVSRSLRVQAAIGNADDRLRSGMAFLISLSFTGESHPAVDPLAIQWGSSGAFVWLVRDGKALRQPIRILQRNSDTVLVDMVVKPGDLVVTEGVQSLRPGSDVKVVSTAADATPKT